MWPQCGAPCEKVGKSQGCAQNSVAHEAQSGSRTGSAAGRARAPETAKNELLFEPLGPPKWLTKTSAKAYIKSLRRAAAWRDGASAKPLTVHTVTEHAAMLSWPCSCRRVEGRSSAREYIWLSRAGDVSCDLGCKAMGCKARRCAVRLFDK